MPTDQRRASSSRTPWRNAAVVAAAATALVIVVYDGYGHHWPWTGISRKTATLSD